jgi:hypothetical protein
VPYSKKVKPQIRASTIHIIMPPRLKQQFFFAAPQSDCTSLL